jgi:uncharacterized membrane protein
MVLLTLGILLWAAVHLTPSVAAPFKARLVARMGENGYKGVFSLLLFAAIALIVFGWRSIDQPEYLYFLPAWTRHAGMLVVVIGFILMGAANYPTRIKRVIRHPQLTGFILWALAHLAMNGDSRSVVLFGGLATWAILEIVFINRRDTEWVKPEAPGWGREVVGVVISLAVVVLFVFIHPWIAGVAIR